MAMFQRLRVWFQGKKTIFGGVILIAVGVAGAWYGKLQPVDALTVVGLGISVCGISAKANRHQAQILAALQTVTEVGVDLRAGNRAAAIAALQPLVREAISETEGTALAEAYAGPVAATPTPSLPQADGAMQPGPARVVTAQEHAEMFGGASTLEAKN